MRPANKQYAKAGTAPVETVRMGIDPDSAEFLMNVFTDLYSDTMMAPIREYISNAIDSHVEAGQTRPIDVRKPSMLKPFFEVEDYGIGMSLDTIRKVYSMYGYSTKRHSDDYVGMLGVGSKSGLTYSNSINITSVHDGTLVHFTISRGNKNADGKVSGNGADIDIHAVEPTDRPNGVKVQIPVADIAEFGRKIDSFVQYARPGSINVDGKPVTGKVEGATKVNDNIFLTTAQYGGTREDIVVAGGVPYRAGKRLSQNLPYSNNVIAYVPVGTVEFTPSREDLQYTAKTQAAIEHIKAVIERDLRAAATADIDGAATHIDAWVKYQTWASMIRGKVKYKGVEIPERGLYTQDRIDFVYELNRYRNAVSQDTKVHISPDYLKSAVIVHNFDNKTVTGSNRSKLKYYFEQQKMAVRTVLIYTGTGSPAAPWDSEVPVVDWADVKAVKVPRAAPGQGTRVNTEPKVEIYDPNSSRYDKRVELDYDAVQGQHLLLVSPGEIKQDSYHEVQLPDIQAVYPDHTLVVIGLNRFDKFEREYDGRTITRFTKPEFKQKAKEFVDGLTDGEIQVLFGSNHDFDVLSSMSADGIDDPDVLAVVNLYRSDATGKRTVWNAYQRIARGFADSYSLLPETPKAKGTKLLDKYPLLGYLGRAPHAQVKRYINLIYKEES